jgi:hypothetical protein
LVAFLVAGLWWAAGISDDRSILIRSGAAKRLQRDLGSGQRLELARKPHLQPGTLSVAVSGPDAATVAVQSCRGLAATGEQSAGRVDRVAGVDMTGMFFGTKGMGATREDW